MHPDTRIQESQHGFLIGSEGRNAQDGVPATLGLEAVRHWQRGKLAIELGKVCGGAGADLVLDGMPARKPVGQRLLDRRIH